MTNTWQDIKNANVVVVMGGNAAEAHPCGFKWVIEAKIENGAKLVVVDPRFTRTASVADLYAPIRPGTDIAFLSGLIRRMLEKDTIQHEYVRAYTNASFVVKDGFSFQDGLFSGFNEGSGSYDKSSWDYVLDEQGFAKVDHTWQDPRCVINLLRKHVARYTPEMVSRICGTPQDKYLEVCDLIASTAQPDKAMTSLFALGWTQHSIGSQNIRTMAMVQLLLGNIGVAGGGMNALRGHSNIQGLTDVGLMSELMPGYLSMPHDNRRDTRIYSKAHANKPLRPNQTSYWQNYHKFFVSFQKSIYGDAARTDNDWAYDWLPKLDVPMYDVLTCVRDDEQRRDERLHLPGFQSAAGLPRSGQDPQGTEQAEIPRRDGPAGHRDRRISGRISGRRTRPTRPASRPRCSSFRPPASPRRTARWSTPRAGCNGTGRRPNRRATRRRHLYHVRDLPPDAGDVSQGRRRFPRSDPEPDLELHRPGRSRSGGTGEGNERPCAGRSQGAGWFGRTPAGRLLDSFASLRDDGTTASGCWIFTGCYTEKGNQMARRDTADPRDQGIAPGWAWAWPANRRILYNRASADLDGKPWNPEKPIIEWNGSAGSASTCPTTVPTCKPSDSRRSVHHERRGVGRLFALDRWPKGRSPNTMSRSSRRRRTSCIRR